MYVLSCDMLKAFEDISRSSTKVRSSPTRFQGVPKVSNSQTKGAQTLASNKILVSLQLDWLFCCMILAQVYWRVRCWRKSHVKKAQGRKIFEMKSQFYMKPHKTPYFICDVANADNQQSSGTSLSLSSTPLATPVCSHHGKPIHSGYESNRFAMRPTKTWRILHETNVRPLSPQLVAAPRTAWQSLRNITLSGWGVSPAQPSDCTEYPTCWSCSDTTHASGTKSKGSLGTSSEGNQDASVLLKTNCRPMRSLKLNSRHGTW